MDYYINTIYDVQNEMKYFYHYNEFLHNLDFVIVFLKNVYALFMLVNLNSNVFLVERDFYKFLLLVSIWLTMKPFCQALFNFLYCCIYTRAFIRNCFIHYFINTNICKFDVLFTYMIQCKKKFIITISKTVTKYRI